VGVSENWVFFAKAIKVYAENDDESVDSMVDKKHFQVPNL
jgi:hypothetical protein